MSRDRSEVVDDYYVTVPRAAPAVAKLRADKPLSRADRAAIADLLHTYECLIDEYESWASGHGRKTGRKPTGDGNLVAWYMTAHNVGAPAAIRAIVDATVPLDRRKFAIDNLRKAHEGFKKKGEPVDPRGAVERFDDLRAKAQTR